MQLARNRHPNTFTIHRHRHFISRNMDNFFTYAQAAQTPAPEPANPYEELQYKLTDASTPIEHIRALLAHPALRAADLRKLFGVIRKALLQDLWSHRDLELWLKRAESFGTHYAGTAAEETSSSKYPSRYAFYRDMDEQLDVADGSEGTVRGMVLQHVMVFRETGAQLKVLREKKVLLLMSGEE